MMRNMRKHPFSARPFGLFAKLIRCAACVLASILLAQSAACAVPAAKRAAPSLFGRAVSRFGYAFPEQARETLYAGREVLVIVPHQDDETLILGGVLEAYRAAGSTVRVVFVTNGDVDGMAETRFSESVAALGLAGIGADDIIFLGYGDQWRGAYPHIYHAPEDAVMTSFAGHTQTYGTAAHGVLCEGTPYTRGNLKRDVRGVIERYAPDTIFCIDFDAHSDHRAVSLLFEEVMGELLREDAAYRPTVYKAFAYGTAKDAELDFYEENIRATKNPTRLPYMREVNYYNWAERVRFPLSRRALSRFKHAISTYDMLAAYASQDMLAYGNSALNGDRVAFLRDTQSLLYTADITASSGDASLLNDFRIIDTQNVTAADCVFSGHVWSPAADDAERTATVTFGEPQSISSIRLYDNPSLDHNIGNAIIAFSDGSTVETGALRENGAATSVSFETKHDIRAFTVRVDAYAGDEAGLCELEAYATAPEYGVSWIKLMNENEDFVYDYWLDASGRERFRLYGFPGAEADLAAAYALTMKGGKGCGASFEGDAIMVTCPPGRSLTLTVTSRRDPAISDAVRISNPQPRWRRLVGRLQKHEDITGY